MTVALTGLKGTGAEVAGVMIVVVMTVEAMKEVAEDHPPVWGKCQPLEGTTEDTVCHMHEAIAQIRCNWPLLV